MDDSAFETALREIVADRSRGAAELARVALGILARSAESAPAGNAAQLRSTLVDRACRLAAARPSMASLVNLAGRFGNSVGGFEARSLASMRAEASRLSRELMALSETATEQAAIRAAGLISPEATVITLSWSSTVLAVFEKAAPGVRAIVGESRPLCEGRHTAARLAEWSIPVMLVADAALGLFVADADMALVGADTILSDGGIVNKVGTYLLALAARDRGIPFYVCAESFKRRREPGLPPLEEMAASELGPPPEPNVIVRNIYFDVTPPGLVTRIVTEEAP